LSHKAERAIGNLLTNLRLYHLDDGADERTRRVILAAVAPSVSPVLDLGFIEV
jgi:hypothetical protein